MTGENMVDESAAMAQTYDAVRNPHPTPPHTPSPALTLKGEGAVCGWVGVGWVGGWVGRWGVGGGANVTQRRSPTAHSFAHAWPSVAPSSRAPG